MSWSISATGTKDEAIAAIKSQTRDIAIHDTLNWQRAKDYILDELEGAPDGTEVSVSASGHADEREQRCSISVSARPAPAARA